MRRVPTKIKSIAITSCLFQESFNGTEKLWFLRPKIWKITPNDLKWRQSLREFKVTIKSEKQFHALAESTKHIFMLYWFFVTSRTISKLFIYNMFYSDENIFSRTDFHGMFACLFYLTCFSYIMFYLFYSFLMQR